MPPNKEQVESVVHRAVQQIITRGLSDPRVRGLISVTRVNVSPDLSEATIFISVMPAEHSELSLRGLRHGAKHVRSQLAAATSLRRVPRLNFRLDESLKKQAEVYDAISRGLARSSAADDQSDTGSELPPIEESSQHEREKSGEGSVESHPDQSNPVEKEDRVS